MKTVKVNFTIPQDVAVALKKQVKSRKRSSFVSDAVRARLKELEDEKLRLLLIKGYKARAQESVEIDTEWEPATLESWE